VQGTIEVRAAAYFNPQVFVEQRATARRKRLEIESHVARLNEQAAKRPHLFNETKMLSAVIERLRRHEMLRLFEVKTTTVVQGEKTVAQVVLKANESEWHKRRRYDGFSVLVANPKLQLAAEEMCRLFRAKDVVERDFREIKSVLELRPLNHHADHKVRAHVSLCMNALLLQRVFERRLVRTPYRSATAAVEILGSCRLNKFEKADHAVYSVTRPNPAQAALLRSLNLSFLADDIALADTLRRHTA
jgi:transposase